MKEIPKPPEYWRWRMNKRLTWEAAIQHPHDSFLAADLEILTARKAGHAMSDFCDEGYFSKRRYYNCISPHIYSVEHPFMAYREEYRRER